MSKPFGKRLEHDSCRLEISEQGLFCNAFGDEERSFHIYDGNPADYHEWEFRTELKIVAFEQQEKRKKKKKKKRDQASFESSSGPEGRRAERSPQAEAEAPARGEGFLGSVPSNRPAAEPSEVSRESRSSEDGSVETVLRVMEALRGDAFQKAKDIGIAALSAPGISSSPLLAPG